MTTRRDFLTGFIKWGFGLIFASFGATLLAFLYPSGLKAKKLSFFPLLKEDDIPKEGVRNLDLPYEKAGKTMTMRVFIVNAGGAVFALSASCSHLGCLVNWSWQKGQFICPCHGGKYDIKGNVIGGPPPLPLSRLPLRIENGMVLVGIKDYGLNG